jgi:hypothetical protein
MPRLALQVPGRRQTDMSRCVLFSLNLLLAGNSGTLPLAASGLARPTKHRCWSNVNTRTVKTKSCCPQREHMMKNGFVKWKIKRHTTLVFPFAIIISKVKTCLIILSEIHLAACLVLTCIIAFFRFFFILGNPSCFSKQNNI